MIVEQLALKNLEVNQGDRNQLNVEKLEASLKYWSSALGMKQHGKNATKKHVDLVFKDGQVPLRLVETGVKIDHKTGERIGL